ncbi:MAG: hypothetical protein J1F13_04645, partial [Prevotellaceae bacterium]|nr:hypothetical protein [Prevotellaceae bacterium]
DPYGVGRFALAFAYRPHAFRHDDAAPARDPYGVGRFVLTFAIRVPLFLERQHCFSCLACAFRTPSAATVLLRLAYRLRRLRLSANFEGVR